LGGVCECAGGASGPADACAFKWFGLIETATRIPQRVAITVFLVFKFASTSALPKAQQVSKCLTLAGQTPTL
jgi:hypothetical protein